MHGNKPLITFLNLNPNLDRLNPKSRARHRERAICPGPDFANFEGAASAERSTRARRHRNLALLAADIRPGAKSLQFMRGLTTVAAANTYGICPKQLKYAEQLKPRCLARPKRLVSKGGGVRFTPGDARPIN
jgi:hypothetical protein